jgi:adenylosuccinate lyase
MTELRDARVEQQLIAISPVDGRYASKVDGLESVFSEHGLIKHRVEVEAGWLAVLGSGVLPDVPAFGDRALDTIKDLGKNFELHDSLRVKDIERETNHDVKAVEYWMREKLAADPDLASKLELIHFGLTSEDVNNLAYAKMHVAGRGILLPHLDNIVGILGERAEEYAGTSLLARTHGQPATPTTVGHEMNVYAHRLSTHAANIGGVVVRGKLNGATGGFAAHAIAYPEVDWPAVSYEFIKEGLGLEPNVVTAQIDPHDWNAELYHAFMRGNTTLHDLATDMWDYISRDLFTQQVVAGEVGSSAMPHKVNPIQFENAWANFGIANALFGHLAEKLPNSRLQRDLSDSSAQRAVGMIFGHTLIGYKAMRAGFSRAHVNAENAAAELDDNWSVLSEAVQSVARRYDVPSAYDLLKEATRGRPLTADSYAKLVMSIDGLPEDARERLLALTPATYTGYSEQLAKQ